MEPFKNIRVITLDIFGTLVNALPAKKGVANADAKMTPVRWKAASQAAPALSALQFLNYRLAAVSNENFPAQTILRDLKLAHFFEKIFPFEALISGQSRAVSFQKIAAELKVAPIDLLHVGTDLKGAVDPAVAAGCRGAWLAPNAYFKPVGASVVRDFSALVEALRNSEITHLRRKINDRATQNLLANLFGRPTRPEFHNIGSPEKPKWMRAPDVEKSPELIGDAILECVKKLTAEMTPMKILRSIWPALTGKFCDQCAPERIATGGILIIHCDNAIIRSELQFLSRKLLGEIKKNAACAHISRLNFTL